MSAWPPVRYCDRCLAGVEVVAGPERGVIAEYSRRDDGTYFCVADFEGIRMMCVINAGPGQSPEVGMRVRLADGGCGGRHAGSNSGGGGMPGTAMQDDRPNPDGILEVVPV